MNLGCTCCNHFAAEVSLECRSVAAVCEPLGGWCSPPFTYPDLPEWSAGDCLDVGVYFISSHGGIIPASNFAGPTGIIVGGFIFDQRKGEWRISHQPSMTCYLKVWIRRWENTFAAPGWDPPVEESETYTDSTYVWEGTGNPCLTDPSKSVLADENRIFSEITEEPVPGRRTFVSIELLKFSYLEGYEPDISDPLNPQPNGFPDPAWEPAPP